MGPMRYWRHVRWLESDRDQNLVEKLPSVTFFRVGSLAVHGLRDGPCEMAVRSVNFCGICVLGIEERTPYSI